MIRAARFAPIGPQDLEALVELFERNDDTALFDPFPLNRDSATRIASEPRKDLYFGTWLEDSLVGMSMLRGWDEGFEIPSFGILVDAEHRGEGLGRRLTEFTIGEARRRGCRRIRLSVYESNVAARTLYARLGFAECERIAGSVAGLAQEKIIMLLDLAIPVSRPALVGNERKYVLEAVDSGWISSIGRFIGEFETAFARQIGAQHAVAVCNGTAALHVALLALGIGPGDEVIVPALTYVACANAILYCGARPVFIESEPETGNLDPARLEELIAPQTKAVLAVHLYGHPVDLDPVQELAHAHGIALIEDAAEAHGARYRGRPVGSLGDIATFSFFGNKIVSSGEGGMVVTNDEALAEKARLLRGQGQSRTRRYWFETVGFNYRMTNVAAAIGLAQMEQFSWHAGRRRGVAAWYAERLSGARHLRLVSEPPFARSAFWMNNVLLETGSAEERDRVTERLATEGVETRPFFYPCHTMPPYRGFGAEHGYPVAEQLAARGISLPSSATLTADDVDYVCEKLTLAVRDVFEAPTAMRRLHTQRA